MKPKFTHDDPKDYFLGTYNNLDLYLAQAEPSLPHWDRLIVGRWGNEEHEFFTCPLPLKAAMIDQEPDFAQAVQMWLDHSFPEQYGTNDD